MNFQNSTSSSNTANMISLKGGKRQGTGKPIIVTVSSNPQVADCNIWGVNWDGKFNIFLLEEFSPVKAYFLACPLLIVSRYLLSGCKLVTSCRRMLLCHEVLATQTILYTTGGLLVITYLLAWVHSKWKIGSFFYNLHLTLSARGGGQGGQKWPKVFRKTGYFWNHRH